MLAAAAAPFTLETGSGRLSLHEASSLWAAIVNEYSSCQLTYPYQDKFIALAGVAREIAIRCPDDYCAGFFYRDLPVCLLWHLAGPVRDGSIHSRGDRCRAPSWSWASIDGPVRLFWKEGVYDLEGLATIKDVHVQLVDTKNAFGQVEHAELVIHGKPLRVSWKLDTQRPIDSHVRQGLHCKNALVRGPTDAHASFTLDLVHDQDGLPRGLYFDGKKEIEHDQSQAVTLPISTRDEYEDVPMVEGLILGSVKDEVNCYVRLGKFSYVSADLLCAVESCDGTDILLL